MTDSTFRNLSQAACIDIARAVDSGDRTQALMTFALAVQDNDAYLLLNLVKDMQKALGDSPEPKQELALVYLRQEIAEQMHARLPETYTHKLETLVAFAHPNGESEKNVRTYFEQ